MDPKQQAMDEEIIQDLEFLMSLETLQHVEELEVDIQDAAEEEGAL